MSLDFLMVNTFAVNHLNHADEVGRQALKSDYCVPWIHIALKPIRYHSTLHTQSLPFWSVRVCLPSHMVRDRTLLTALPIGQVIGNAKCCGV